MSDPKKPHSEQGKIPMWSSQTYIPHQSTSRTWPDNFKMTKADMLDKWRDLYEQIFPILLEDNLRRLNPKTPETLAQETAEHVNEAIEQYQIMEEKVEGIETLSETEL